MNAPEFDSALSDLETRVDRLRALYENWFRGYEKTEPAVARKEVERRVQGLRKELPRNTALRFRYQQLCQRYSTLAHYWQRTARQIEEGTYRLQLQRVKRRHDPLKRRDDEAPEGETLPPRSYALDLDETLDVSKLLDDLELDEVGRALDEAPPERARPQPSAGRPSTVFARPSTANELPPLLSRRPPENDVAPLEPSGPPSRSLPALPARPPQLKIPPPAPPSPAGRPNLPPLPPSRPSLPGAAIRPPPPPLPSGASGGRSLPAPPVPPPRAPEPPRAPAASAGPLSEQHMRRIHAEYTAARRKNNEGEVRFETLASSIQKMLPDLHRKHHGKQIDFEVVVKDGRVGLRPKAS